MERKKKKNGKGEAKKGRSIKSPKKNAKTCL